MKRFLKYGAVFAALALAITCFTSCKDEEEDGPGAGSSMTILLPDTTAPYFGYLFDKSGNQVTTEEHTLFKLDMWEDINGPGLNEYNYNKNNAALLKCTINGTYLTFTVLRGDKYVGGNVAEIYDGGHRVGKLYFDISKWKINVLRYQKDKSD